MKDNSHYIENIVKNNKPIQTGITIPEFPRKKFNVYEIILDILKFNPYNDRIASYIKSIEYKLGENIDWFCEEKQNLIAKFLWESDILGNEKTIKDILKNKQHTYAVIDKNGIVIDGNRRLCILRKICSSINHNKDNINDFNILKTVVIEDCLTQKQIMRLETQIQMGQDEKLDYRPIEKYLKVDKLLNNGFTENEIGSLMNKKHNEIRSLKKIYNNMKDYLIFIDAENQFEYIKGFEDHFINLTNALENLKSRKFKTNWNYNENDIFSLKKVAFLLIRSGYKDGFEGKSFRNIFGSATKKNGCFSDKEIWEQFKCEILKKDEKLQKAITHKKNNNLIKNKEDEELFYSHSSKKDYEQNLKIKSNILAIKQDGFKGDYLMQNCYESLNKFNEIIEFEETIITPNLRKNFNKTKDLISIISTKIEKIKINHD